jgi:membrane-associated phospholipid phosphatase
LTAAIVVALAAQAEAWAEPPPPLAYALEVDGPIALGSGAAWFTAIALRESIGPAACHWCATNPFDIAVRDSLVWKDTSMAGVLVDVIGFAVGPAATLGADYLAARHEGAWKDSLVDALLVAEAAGVASDVNLAFRFASARQRPWAWAAAQSPQSPQPAPTRDANMSFYSGHATMMFAVATAAGTVATMRGYRWTPLVWIVGLPFALATAYLRIASDDHWASDVLVGVAAGTATGVAIPVLAHRPVRIVATPGGASLLGSF